MYLFFRMSEPLDEVPSDAVGEVLVEVPQSEDLPAMEDNVSLDSMSDSVVTEPEEAPVEPEAHVEPETPVQPETTVEPAVRKIPAKVSDARKRKSVETKMSEDTNLPKRNGRTSVGKSLKPQRASVPTIEEVQVETNDVATITPVKKPRKHRKPLFAKKVHKEGCERPHRFRPGTRALSQIRKLQKYPGTLLPRSVIKDLIACVFAERQSDFRIQRSAVNAIHVLFEANAVQLFQSAQNFALHRNRLGVHQKDFEMAVQYRNLTNLPNCF
jgi:histone H3